MPFYPSYKIGGGTYSLSEIKTGNKWIDDSDIYRKVIDFGALPNATTKTINHGITGLSQVVSINAIMKITNNLWSTLNFINPISLNEGTYVAVTGTGVTIGTGVDRSGSTAIIVIEYTKTS